MKWLLRSLLALLLVSIVTSALLIVAAMLSGAPLEHAVIRIDDASFTLGDLSAGHWLLAFAGVALACMIVMLVVPFAVLLPLAFAAVSVTVALAFAAAVLGIVSSPLILIGWLIWRAVRTDSKSAAPSAAPSTAPSPAAAPAAPATIAG